MQFDAVDLGRIRDYGGVEPRPAAHFAAVVLVIVADPNVAVPAGDVLVDTPGVPGVVRGRDRDGSGSSHLSGQDHSGHQREGRHQS